MGEREVVGSVYGGSAWCNSHAPDVCKGEESTLFPVLADDRRALVCEACKTPLSTDLQKLEERARAVLAGKSRSYVVDAGELAIVALEHIAKKREEHTLIEDVMGAILEFEAFASDETKITLRSVRDYLRKGLHVGAAKRVTHDE